MSNDKNIDEIKTINAELKEIFSDVGSKANTNLKKREVKRKREEDARRKAEMKHQRELNNLVETAKTNGEKYLDDLIIAIIKEYQESPRVIRNFVPEMNIEKYDLFDNANEAFESNPDYSQLHLAREYNTNKGIKEEERIYFYLSNKEEEDRYKQIWLPIIINSDRLAKIGLFDKFTIEESYLSATVRMETIKQFIEKATNGELDNNSIYGKIVILHAKKADLRIAQTKENFDEYLKDVESNTLTILYDLFRKATFMLRKAKKLVRKYEIDIPYNYEVKDKYRDIYNETSPVFSIDKIEHVKHVDENGKRVNLPIRVAYLKSLLEKLESSYGCELDSSSEIVEFDAEKFEQGIANAIASLSAIEEDLTTTEGEYSDGGSYAKNFKSSNCEG